MHQAILAEDPEAIRESMREFALSVDRVDEIERSGEHIGKWVAAYKDKLLVANSHEDLMRQVDEAGFVRSNTETRFMEDGNTIFIL